VGLLSWLFDRERRRRSSAQHAVSRPSGQAVSFGEEGQRTSSTQLIANLPGPGTYSIEVVGESHYQEALEKICGIRTEEGANLTVEATLIHENDNPYDNKAIRIDIAGRTVGYLSRQNARQYRAKLREAGHPGITATCSAKIVGGWDRGQEDRGYFGVRLDLPAEEDAPTS
jgi:hypothetical protein